MATQSPQFGQRAFLLGIHSRSFREAIGQAAVSPRMVPQQAAQPAGQSVGHVEGGNPRLFEFIQSGGGAPAAGPQEYDALFAAVSLGDHLLGLGIGPGAGHHQCAHLGLVDHVVHDFRKGLAVGKAGDVRRVGRPSEVFQDAVYSIPGPVAEDGKVETGLAAHVGGQGTDPSRVRHHGDAWFHGPGCVGQQLGDFQQLVVVLHPDHPVLLDHGVVEGVLAGKRCSVGTGGAGAQIGPADFDQHDGFAPLGCQLGQLYKLPAVLEAFDKTSDNLGGIVVQQVAGEVGEIQVGLVAGGHDVAEPHTTVDGSDQEGPKGRCAALAHQAHGTAEAVGAPGRRAGPDIVLDVGQAQAVGSANSEARLPSEGSQLSLQVTAVIHSPFGKTGGDHDRCPGPLLVAFSQDVQHPVVGDHDAHQIGGFGQVGDAGVAPGVLDLLVAGIDRVNPYPVLGFQYRRQHSAAVLHARRGSHDGDGAGVEHLVDGCHLGIGPSGHVVYLWLA